MWNPFEEHLFSEREKIDVEALAIYQKNPSKALEYLTNYTQTNMEQVVISKLFPLILCHNCGLSIERDYLFRSCSNCFACTGCERYICPGCGKEIIVKPKKEQQS